MTDERLNELLELRILVLSLGEAQHLRWWKSRFLTPVGLSHLSYLYPRSTFGAAVHGAGRAARIVHDSSIGVGNVFHLFRFPQDIERQLDEALASAENELRSRFEPMLSQRQVLLDALGGLSVPRSASKMSIGPIRMGSAEDIRSSECVDRLATAYLVGLRDGVRVFPYFDGGKGMS